MTARYRPINVVIADDHKIFRDGFTLVFQNNKEIKLIGEAENGLELVKITRDLKPDVVITDIRMEKLDGVEATLQIKAEFPEIAVIALTMSDNEQLIGSMLSAGARGYILKTAETEEIISAIKAVNDNRNYYCRRTATKLAHMIAASNFNPYNPPTKIEFSEKEVEVIKLICQECSNKEIADKLNLSTRTIEGYKEKVLEKIKAKNSVGIAIYALQHHILEGKS